MGRGPGGSVLSLSAARILEGIEDDPEENAGGVCNSVEGPKEGGPGGRILNRSVARILEGGADEAEGNVLTSGIVGGVGREIVGSSLTGGPGGRRLILSTARIFEGVVRGIGIGRFGDSMSPLGRFLSLSIIARRADV